MRPEGNGFENLLSAIVITDMSFVILGAIILKTDFKMVNFDTLAVDLIGAESFEE